ncbi:unnamed protein product [Rotaria socialis]|uniref:Uncharacterized protein n=1 Tax=Rotaria socialis TaxID=392032 RepID=A0A820YZM6_9BILA|nr:unnamed protein product [Rotaria socialis]CAF4550229.1 unnamed protein product [Rotaria socialis]
MIKYLYSYHISKFRIDEPTKLVFEELTSTKKTSSNRVAKEQFKFAIEQFQSAVRSAHDKLKGLSGGCTPAQRSFPLNKSPHEQTNDANNENAIIQSCDSHTSRVTIDIDEPIETRSITSCQNINIENQKKVQHAEKNNNKTIGNVADVSISCQDRPAQHDLWGAAVNTTFSTVPNLLAEIREIQARYKHDSILNSHGSPGYVPNALHTALYCVTNADSFESALRRAKKLDDIYCPILVGMLAGARWGIPSSIINIVYQDVFNEIRQIEKCFMGEWKKQPVVVNCLPKSCFAMPQLHA